jgi:outer membrane lipoprotein SlyB
MTRWLLNSIAFGAWGGVLLAPVAASAQNAAPAPRPAAVQGAAGQSAAAAPDCTSYPCGRVESIKQTSVKQQWTPLGAGIAQEPGQAGGRVATTVQIGPGLSNQGLVTLGAGGGAAYRKSPNAYDKPRWEVTVKLDSGQTRVVTLAFEPFVREGDRVRVAGNSLELVD